MDSDNSDLGHQAYRDRYAPEESAAPEYTGPRQLTVRGWLDMEVMARVKPDDPICKLPGDELELSRDPTFSPYFSLEKTHALKAAARSHFASRYPDVFGSL